MIHSLRLTAILTVILLHFETVILSLMLSLIHDSTLKQRLNDCLSQMLIHDLTLTANLSENQMLKLKQTLTH